MQAPPKHSIYMRGDSASALRRGAHPMKLSLESPQKDPMPFTCGGGFRLHHAHRASSFRNVPTQRRTNRDGPVQIGKDPGLNHHPPPSTIPSPSPCWICLWIEGAVVVLGASVWAWVNGGKLSKRNKLES